MKLNEEILEKVKRSEGCRAEIRKALNIPHYTLSRYLRDNNDNLTKLAALKAIGDYFNLTPTQLVEPVNEKP